MIICTVQIISDEFVYHCGQRNFWCFNSSPSPFTANDMFLSCSHRFISFSFVSKTLENKEKCFPEPQCDTLRLFFCLLFVVFLSDSQSKHISLVVHLWFQENLIWNMKILLHALETCLTTLKRDCVTLRGKKRHWWKYISCKMHLCPVQYTQGFYCYVLVWPALYFG